MQPHIRWQWTRFDDLEPRHLYALLRARGEVFIIEQRCAFLDTDGIDLRRLASARMDRAEAGAATAIRAAVLAAYLRLIDPGRIYAEASIGRVLTVAAVPAHRSRPPADEGRPAQGGRALSRARGTHRCADPHSSASIRAWAFTPCRSMYIEDGIEHVQMLRPADAAPDAARMSALVDQWAAIPRRSTRRRPSAYCSTGVFKGGFGGGPGGIAVALMSMFVAPADAAGIVLPILCAMDIFGAARLPQQLVAPSRARAHSRRIARHRPGRAGVRRRAGRMGAAADRPASR